MVIAVISYVKMLKSAMNVLKIKIKLKIKILKTNPRNFM